MIKNKIIVGLTLISVPLLLAACGNSSSSSKSSSATTSMSAKSTSSKKTAMTQIGAIVGSYNSPDKKVVGATLPGKSVNIEIPVAGNDTYVHFAFMHAKSANNGWYFAPKSENGLLLKKSMFKNGTSVDVTNDIALFAAPNATTVTQVMKDAGSLKFGATTDFMKATIKMNGDMYELTIKNMSKGDMETPFSSGVWSSSDKGMKSFDQNPSKALSELATMGHRDALLTQVKMENK